MLKAPNVQTLWFALTDTYQSGLYTTKQIQICTAQKQLKMSIFGEPMYICLAYRYYLAHNIAENIHKYIKRLKNSIVMFCLK